MNKRSAPHLGETQILKAVIDKADLEDAEQSHLSVCPTCRHRVVEAENQFLRLGEMAARYAPQPTRPLRRLPYREKRTAAPWMFGWRPALASAVGILLLIVSLTWWPGAPWRHGEEPVDTAGLERIDDTVLMAEVEALIDEALPVPYLSIAPEDEPRMTDDFMRFVAPVTENDSLTLYRFKGGWASWQRFV